MRVDCALLCDAVTVREGLLHILGGGVTRIGRDSFPAPLGVALAVRVMVHPTEAATEHLAEVVLLAEDGEQIGTIQANFNIEDPSIARPGEELSVMFPIPMQPLPIPRPGAYSFELLIDGVHQQSVAFVAEEALDEDPEAAE